MLVAHIVFRFDYGGLENGIVNIINGLRDDPIRHTVIALTEATEFANRLHSDVTVHALRKKPGKDVFAYARLYRLLRSLKPDIVHTRNVGTMDCAFIAFLARVPVRIHGEHGWDVADPDGEHPKYRRMRRVLHRFVHRIVTVSDHLRRWLVDTVGLPGEKIVHICNGVDTNRFHPRSVPGTDSERRRIVIGSVTRFSPIKDPLNLVQAFVELRRAGCDATLLMVGDGELHAEAVKCLENVGVQAAGQLPGSRDDIDEALRDMDIFALGSKREGISNTILEAMATGLPIVACNVGGNPELVADGENGTLVPPEDTAALAAAIRAYLDDPGRRRREGHASRERAVGIFSLDTMVQAYRRLYSDVAAAGQG